MNSIYKKTGFYALFTCITILFSALIQMPVYAAKPLEVKANNSFRISVTTPQTDTITLAGESEYMATPSSYTITMKGENGRCVIHMLNFTTPPGPGTYDVTNAEIVRTAAVCVLEGIEPRERLASHSGTFTITEIRSDYIKGQFDMILMGPISGKEFHLKGEVSSEIVPTNLHFGH